MYQNSSNLLYSRGGVEDTRLEAKDIKNPRPRPKTYKKSEAKAKDRNARGQGQGHKRSGGFRGGMGGMHSPHQPKSNDFGRKISLYFD